VRKQIGELIASGRLMVGTQLYHRSHRTPPGELEARVVEGGIEVGGSVYPSASTAARAAIGHSANGWTFWRVRPSGVLLDEIRKG